MSESWRLEQRSGLAERGGASVLWLGWVVGSLQESGVWDESESAL